MRNFAVALLLSQGTPMIVMGDEFAKSHSGNNNWYGHDNGMAHMQWPAEGTDGAAFNRCGAEPVLRCANLFGHDNALQGPEMCVQSPGWRVRCMLAHRPSEKHSRKQLAVTILPDNQSVKPHKCIWFPRCVTG